MSTLVIVGLIGSGKTTLALSLELTHRIISFDREWHELRQNNEAGELNGAPIDAVRAIAEIINTEPRPVVVDGWWTWTDRWWETEGDVSLSELGVLTAEHPIRLLHLVAYSHDAAAAYRVKWLTGMYRDTPLDDHRAYAASIPARQAYLSRKVAEWAR